jgi:TRAP-type transport system periplasmic protein
MRKSKRLTFFTVIGLLLIISLLVCITGCSSSSPTPAPTNKSPSTQSSSVASVTSSTAPAMTSTSPAKVYSLKLGWGMPASVWQSKVISRFIDNVKIKTSERIVITPYFDQTLFPPKEQVNAIKSGLADVGIFYTINNPGEFPVTDLISLPFLFQNSKQSLGAFDKLYAEGLMPEYTGKGFKTMGFANMGWLNVMTKSKDIDSFSKLKGLKMYSPNPTSTQALILLGATPVMLSSMDIYMSIDRGVIDGAVLGTGFFAAMKTYEVAHSILNQPLSGLVVFTAMNQKTWDSLPADLQQTMIQCYKEFGDDWNKAVDDNELGRDIQLLKDKGVVFQTISPDDLTRAKQATKSIIDDYKVSLDKLGLKGQQIMDICNAIIAQNK